MKIRSVCLTLWLATAAASGENWQTALSRMPLVGSARELNRTNCVPLMLGAFQSNETVKALIFMPGATDEFYMFRRARAVLTNNIVSLLEAVTALTNQTMIRVTFRPPLLLLHTDEDPLEPLAEVKHPPTVQQLQNRHFVPHALYNDRDWDFIQPILKKNLKVAVMPWRHTYDTWHFYRHSFAEWGLTGWEALEAVALAGKTRFSVERHRIVFEGDERVRATPKIENFLQDTSR